MEIIRPQVPEIFYDTGVDITLPSKHIEDWIHTVYLTKDQYLYDSRHEHLIGAHVGVLLSSYRYIKGDRLVNANVEIFSPKGSIWQKARQEEQIVEWFGSVPDFIITVYSSFAISSKNAEFCATIEHELYHVAHKGANVCRPQYTEDGRPVYKLVGHDVEEFVGIVRRYGAKATGVQDLVDAANEPPLFTDEDIQIVCGNCN